LLFKAGLEFFRGKSLSGPEPLRYHRLNNILPGLNHETNAHQCFSVLIRIRSVGRKISEEFNRPCFFVLSNRFVRVASTLNQNLFPPTVASRCLHFPAPKSWFNSLRIATVDILSGLFLADVFLWTSSLLAFCYGLFSLIRVCFDPVVANVLSVFSLSRRTDPVPQCRDWLVIFPEFTLADKFFWDTFSNRMPGFSLLSESKTVLIWLLPTFSPPFPVPKNWFSHFKLPPDWKTFWPCFAAGFFLSFYPFRLPCSISNLYWSRFDPAVASIFSVSFVSKDTYNRLCAEYEEACRF